MPPLKFSNLLGREDKWVETQVSALLHPEELCACWGVEQTEFWRQKEAKKTNTKRSRKPLKQTSPEALIPENSGRSLVQPRSCQQFAGCAK